MNRLKSLRLVLLVLIIVSCNSTTNKKATIQTNENGVAILSDEQIEDIVKRSYQYVAMYNVNNKTALSKEGITTDGYNKGIKMMELLDHEVKLLARPNNDVLYQTVMMDLRKDAFVIEMPAMESKYVSLLTGSYDHYVQIPFSTVKGDFQEALTILLYTERTEGYKGGKIEGINETFEMTGDFVQATFRVMPHADEPERFKRVIEQINELKWMTLSEFLCKPAPKIDDVEFPAYGTTDADIFENNLLEVMQFVFNHTTFDPDFELDREVLAVYEPLGIVPGKEYNPDKAVKIDGKKFREISIKIRDEELAKFNNPEVIGRLLPTLFQPKGSENLESLLLPSVVGPLGMPAKEAMYPPVIAEDGAMLNAQNDYVIRMTKNEMPPANAFWSFTLYDAENGFFIPNENKKYSVGENAGMKLNEDGGIEIYIAAEKPDEVPAENWLPIERKDLDMNMVLRIYAPDLEKMKTWKAPKAEKL